VIILYYFLLGILIASQSNILIAFVTDIVSSLKIIYNCAIIKVPTKSFLLNLEHFVQNNKDCL